MDEVMPAVSVEKTEVQSDTSVSKEHAEVMGFLLQVKHFAGRSKQAFCKRIVFPKRHTFTLCQARTQVALWRQLVSTPVDF